MEDILLTERLFKVLQSLELGRQGPDAFRSDPIPEIINCGFAEFAFFHRKRHLVLRQELEDLLQVGVVLRLGPAPHQNVVQINETALLYVPEDVLQ